jgi:hypothetical protein
MRQRLEAIIDDQGNLQLLETIKLPTSRRAIVIILPDELESNISQQAFEGNKIEIHFVHPREPKTFTAEIDPECTGEEALKGLLKGDKNGPFLDTPRAGQPYELIVSNTQQVIIPKMTFAQAGVVQDDTIEVRQAGQGAGFNYTEIAGLAVSSGLGLAFLKAVASVITQFIKSREKTFEFEKDGERYKLTANSSVKEMIEVVKALKGESILEPHTSIKKVPMKSSKLFKEDSDSTQRVITARKRKHLAGQTTSSSTSAKKSISTRSKVKKRPSKKRQA